MPPADRITRVARLRSIDQFRAHLQRIGADLPLADQLLNSDFERFSDRVSVLRPQADPA